MAVDHSRYASRDSSRRGPFEGVLAVLVHSIVDFSDTAGFMDKTDPFVELKVGHRKVRITERDSKKMNPKKPVPESTFFTPVKLAICQRLQFSCCIPKLRLHISH